MKEQQPKTEINNLPAFQGFFDTYASDISANPFHKKPFPDSLPIDPVSTVLNIKEDSPFREKHVRLNLKGNFYINGIPWNEIPESLQRMISLQYDAANLDEEKRVNIRGASRMIVLSLDSLNASQLIDKYGEYYASTGLLLIIEQVPLSDILNRIYSRPRINEGDFIVRRISLSAALRFDSLFRKSLSLGNKLTPDEKEFIEKIAKDIVFGKYIQIIPSSLIHLQDLAQLLETQKQNAFIYSD